MEAPVAGPLAFGTGFQPGGSLTPGAVRALQASAGNAAVSRLIAVGGVRQPTLSRQPAPAAAPPAEHKTLSAADRKRLEDARQRVDVAKARKESTLDALTKYTNEAPKHLSKLKADADRNLEMYKGAANHVNFIISEAKEIAKVQDEVIGEIVGAALGGVGLVVAKIGGKVKETYDHIKEKWELAKEHLEEYGLPDLAGAVKKGVAGEPAAETGPAISEPWAQELEFYKSFAQLHANSTELLGVGVVVGRIGEPIGRVDEAIAGILNSGVTRTDYPIEHIEKDADSLETGANGLAKATERITGLLADLQSAVDQSKASMPKDDMEVEKKLWKSWAAGLLAAPNTRTSTSTTWRST